MEIREIGLIASSPNSSANAHRFSSLAMLVSGLDSRRPEVDVGKKVQHGCGQVLDLSFPRAGERVGASRSDL